MEIVHYSLTCSSIENADRFFSECLGLKKTTPKKLGVELSKGLFGIDRELDLLYYEKDDCVFEIVIHQSKGFSSNGINHICLKVDDFNLLMNQVEFLGFKIIQQPKGEKTITFIADFDGNLFEIK